MKKLLLLLLLTGYSLVILPSLVMLPVDQDILDMHPRFQDYAQRSKVQVDTLYKKRSDCLYLRLYLSDETQALKKELASMKSTEKSLQDQLKKLKAVYIPFGKSVEKTKTEIESTEASLDQLKKDQKEFTYEIQSHKERLLRLDMKLKIIKHEQQRIKDTENAYHERALNQIIAQNAGRVPSSFNRKDIEVVKESLMDQDRTSTFNSMI